MQARPLTSRWYQTVWARSFLAVSNMWVWEWSAPTVCHPLPCSSNKTLLMNTPRSLCRPHCKKGSACSSLSVWGAMIGRLAGCLLYTSDAADDLLCVDLGG